MAKIIGARENNLKHKCRYTVRRVYSSDWRIGLGQSSLINEILYKSWLPSLTVQEQGGRHDAVLGTEHLDKVINIDQSPIGGTPRSNPATYTGVFDLIRKLRRHAGG